MVPPIPGAGAVNVHISTRFRLLSNVGSEDPVVSAWTVRDCEVPGFQVTPKTAATFPAFLIKETGTTRIGLAHTAVVGTVKVKAREFTAPVDGIPGLLL